MASALAVNVQNASKSYGKHEVLKNLRMNVPKGSIYGLLGSSGCGKTTLLSCIVGQKALDSGEIWVLGGQPGTEGSGVPGPKVGYMPQEIALVGEFTVKDAIFYFGRVFNMSEKEIEERFYELTNLLDLPPQDRFIRNCSGGQQRRISFAASMVQTPELLILDEPTVGVDPILRERIWDYLIDITRNKNVAVIVTTHYIEECRQANLIGLLRDGYLLAEESPMKLLRMYNTDILEEVFLLLSQKQADGQLNQVSGNHSWAPIQSSNTDISVASFDTTRGSTDILTPKSGKKKKQKMISGYSLNGKRMKALLDKNWKQFYRNVSGMVFTLLFPVAEILAFLVAVGNDPQNISLAIVNQESINSCQNFVPTNSAIPYDIDFRVGCTFNNLSCRFLQYVDDPMINKVPYESLSDAMADIKHGKVVGALFMGSNFTESFEERIENGRDVDEYTSKNGEIKVWMDMSNRQIGETMKYKLLKQYLDFQKDLVKDCDFNEKFVDYWDIEYFYGSIEDTYSEFMVPGIIMTMMFFLMTIMSSQIIVHDRSEGLWDRSIVAGVSSSEICLTHFVMQLGIVIIYTVQLLVLTFVIFDKKIAGSTWLIALITVLQGVNGVGYGFWVSIVSRDINMSNVLATGTFYIMILICGCVWPLEGMPTVLQWLSRLLPFTIPIESFRSVMKKGLPFTNSQVWTGIGVEAIWAVIFTIVNVVLVNAKR